MPLLVKICGLCSEPDVRAVAALKPDALGFVFWPGSKRCVKPADVAAWTRGLPPGILKVGVFVDHPVDEIERIVQEAGLDVVQWHSFPDIGKKTGDFSNDWKNAPPDFPMIGKFSKIISNVWKVVRLEGGGPPPEGAAFVDAYLVDSYSAESPGGTGRTGNWGAAREFVRRCGKPVVLAGGLTPENAAEAIRAVRPWGVDVSSGVELSPGRKDLQKVERFIRACRESA